MKYLKNFETDPQYQLYMGGEPILPNVSYVKDNNLIYYNPDPTNGHPYVEIGGIKWATMNIGATSETDPGLYFQWGDTVGYTASQVGTGEGKKAFSWEDYKWTNDNGTTMTKYNATDNKKTLDLEDDVAHVLWGGEWRIPTIEEFRTFLNAINTEDKINYNDSGINGLLCTDKTDSSKLLFLPVSGLANSGSMMGNFVIFWSSSLTLADSYALMWVGRDGIQQAFRSVGFPIRPVIA